MSNTPSFGSNFQQLIDDQDTKALARILQGDQEICAAGGLPSLLAFKLKGISQALADEVAKQLLQGSCALNVPASIQRLQFQEIITGIKGHAQRLSGPTPDIKANKTTEHKFSSSELQGALRVIQTIVDTKLDPRRPISEAISAIQSQLDKPEEPLEEQSSSDLQSALPSYRSCYICYTNISKATSHADYSSLCATCGAFNVSSSGLSLPADLSLNGKTALVTGGRLNLGFHVALRLLRCGARVIVTTRYPQDAERRYRQQADFKHWQSQLRIIGADFRTSRDVFRLANLARQVLENWSDGVPHLDILVNNAAQTLTDTVTAESRAIALESKLGALNESSQVLVDHDRGYIPRVRGGIQSLALGMAGLEKEQLLLGSSVHQSKTITSSSTTLSQHSTRPESSWTQTLGEIPYEDVISAHSINIFVPLILIRELLPFMGTDTSIRIPPEDSDTGGTTSLDPAGYIINVSSREGIFDSLSPSMSSGSAQLRKAQCHVHTNMSKAALNMITETEAAACWHDRRVCMNSVDPGYMSAAPGFGRNIPLKWEDGAGRVLWPVAVGWGKQQVRTGSSGRPVWGKFLKHYRPSRWGGEAF